MSTNCVFCNNNNLEIADFNADELQDKGISSTHISENDTEKDGDFFVLKSDKKIRVVSMPSVDTFEAQDDAYQTSVLADAPTVVVEAAVEDGWYKYADEVVGINRFGESAPAGELFKEFGFTVENVVKAVESVL